VRLLSLERILPTPVPSLAVIVTRDPLMPPAAGELAHVINFWLDGERSRTTRRSQASHRSWRSGAETRDTELPLQPTLPDARPAMVADIGARRGIRNGATTSSFHDPETRQLQRTQPLQRALSGVGLELGGAIDQIKGELHSSATP
jgi:hypothetical protein